VRTFTSLFTEVEKIKILDWQINRAINMGKLSEIQLRILERLECKDNF